MFKVLVTGGSSFIGEHLVNKLIENSAIVSILVRRKTSVPSRWYDYVRVIEGDVTDRRSMNQLSDSFDTVFHLAAYVHKNPRSSEDIKDVHNVNVNGTKNLLEALNSDVRHVIFISSVSVYGVESGENIDEGNRGSPKTEYGLSKLEAERILSDWGRERGVRTTSLRLPLVYGPGNKGHIYQMVDAINKGRFMMIGKGENRKSMVYVGNVVDAALLLMDRQDSAEKTYIVTDSIDYTMKELYIAIVKELSKKPLPFFIPLGIAKYVALAGDIGGHIIGRSLLFNSEIFNKFTSTLTFSSRKIRKEIGFEPKYNLYNTINKTILWYRENNN